MKKVYVFILVLGYCLFSQAQKTTNPFFLTYQDRLYNTEDCLEKSTQFSELKIKNSEGENYNNIALTLTLNNGSLQEFDHYEAFHHFDLKLWLLQHDAFVENTSLTFTFYNNKQPLTTFTLCIIAEAVTTAEAPSRGNTATADYVKLPVYFATDRNYISGKNVYETFGTNRSKLRYGVCTVSIPHDHRVGLIESPSIWKLEFSEDPEKHVVLHTIKTYTKSDFYKKLQYNISTSKSKSSFVFLHGYNTSFADAAKRTAQISYDLKFDGEAVFYSWPSKENLAEYTRDEANIEWAQHDIEIFLKDYLKNSGAEKIYLVAHSMGNRGLTKAIINVIKEEPELKDKIEEIILAAPDIDADVFKRDIGPDLVSIIGKPITLYVSADDMALEASKEVHGYARAGNSKDGIMLVNGIETIDATGIDTSFLSHSYFADTTSIIADIYSLIKSKQRAFYRKTLELIKRSNTNYWKVKH